MNNVQAPIDASKLDNLDIQQIMKLLCEQEHLQTESKNMEKFYNAFM